MKRLTPLLVAGLLAFGALPASATTQSVSIVDNAFSPSPKTVARGDKVIWTNTGGNAHTTTGDSPLSYWGSPTLGHGTTLPRPADTPPRPSRRP